MIFIQRYKKIVYLQKKETSRKKKLNKLFAVFHTNTHKQLNINTNKISLLQVNMYLFTK